jgi:hypothetical protein
VIARLPPPLHPRVACRHFRLIIYKGTLWHESQIACGAQQTGRHTVLRPGKFGGGGEGTFDKSQKNKNFTAPTLFFLAQYPLSKINVFYIPHGIVGFSRMSTRQKSWGIWLGHKKDNNFIFIFNKNSSVTWFYWRLLSLRRRTNNQDFCFAGKLSDIGDVQFIWPFIVS